MLTQKSGPGVRGADSDGAQAKNAPRPRSRFRPDPHAPFRPQERDLDLIVEAYRSRLFTARQAVALGYFGSVPRANDRLRGMYDHALLRRLFPPLSPWGAQALYALGPAGVPLVATRLGLDARGVRRDARPGAGTQFAEHTLAVTDFRIALLAGCGERGAAAEWHGERECFHAYELREHGGEWQRRTLRPDGMGVLRAGTVQRVFAEIDRGNVASAKFAAKAASYAEYAATGAFARRHGAGGFLVATVTTGRRRLDHLRSLARDTAGARFLFSTFDEVEGEGALSRIWRTPDGCLTGLLDLG